MRSSTAPDTVVRSWRQVSLFAALSHRDFRYLWLSFSCSGFVSRMDGMVLGWLVLELTNSAFLVGLITAARFVGALLGPLAGVVADRMDRRRLLMVSLALMTLIVATLSGLIGMRRLEVWHLFVATALWGVLWAFHLPAQQSMLADVLSGRALANGIALTNTARNITSIAGPAIGGALLACCRPSRRVWEWSEAEMMMALNRDSYDAGKLYAGTNQGHVWSSSDHGFTWGPVSISLPDPIVRTLMLEGAATGVQWAYLVLLGLHLLQMLSYASIRSTHRSGRLARTSIWQNLGDGMRYICAKPGLWTALGLAGMINLVAFPLQFGLLPIFARDVFSVDAAGLGLLGAAIGVGALLGSLLMAAVGTLHHAGRLMLTGCVSWMLLLFVFGVMPNYHAALVVLVLLGVAQTITMANITILLLGTTSAEMRGRIMGIRSLAVSPLFLGSVLAGAAVEKFGVPLTTAASAVIGLLSVALVAPWVPKGTAR